MNKKTFYRVSPFDYIFACLILIACFSVLLSFKDNDIADNTKAVIFQNGKLIKEVYLHDRTTDGTLIIPGAVTVECAQRGIRIMHADCPQKICKHAGWIQKPGQTIVCVPNKILIEITGSGQTYDAISY